MGDVVLIPSIKVSHVLWAFHSLYFVFVNAHVNILQKSCETDNKIMLKKLNILRNWIWQTPSSVHFSKIDKPFKVWRPQFLTQNNDLWMSCGLHECKARLLGIFIYLLVGPGPQEGSKERYFDP